LKINPVNVGFMLDKVELGLVFSGFPCHYYSIAPIFLRLYTNLILNRREQSLAKFKAVFFRIWGNIKP